MEFHGGPLQIPSFVASFEVFLACLRAFFLFSNVLIFVMLPASVFACPTSSVQFHPEPILRGQLWVEINNKSCRHLDLAISDKICP